MIRVFARVTGIDAIRVFDQAVSSEGVCSIKALSKFEAVMVSHYNRNVIDVVNDRKYVKEQAQCLAENCKCLFRLHRNKRLQRRGYE